MSNRVNVDRVSLQARRSIAKCRECRRSGDEYVLCGWHENVVVAFTVVETIAGTTVEVDEDD